MTLKNSLLFYFHTISIILGLIDYEVKNIYAKMTLKIFNKLLWLVLLSTGPFYFYFIYFTHARQLFTQMLLIMWSIEYLTLFLMTCILFYTVANDKKSIECLINEGIRIFCASKRPINIEQEKTLKIFFLKIFAFDHIILALEIFVCVFIHFSEKISFQILSLLCFTMNFISFFTTSAFTFVVILIWWEFEEINSDMALDIIHDNHLSFLKDLQAHRHLRSFCHRVTQILSNICLANLLYAFTTTLSGVCNKNWEIFGNNITLFRTF